MHARALSAAVLLVFTCSGECGSVLNPANGFGRLFETGSIAQRHAGEFGVNDGQTLFVGP